jgi:beta-galactosidase
VSPSPTKPAALARWKAALCLFGLWALALATGVPPTVRAQTAGPTRQRTLLNDDWRFQKGDPSGASASLMYDVRPPVAERNDDKPAEAEPTAAAKTATRPQPVLKPWILPTGNRFVKDPAARHARPAGDPGADVPYVKADFDDRAWPRVNLPHDWAISGPFITEGPGGGMGRLPIAGVGWYRRKLDIPASDAGKSIFLDVDGAMSYATVWLNGRLVGGWPYGYTSWRVDLTPYVVPGGANQLAVRLDNPDSSSRWYPGAGIYRNVWLTRTHPIHVGQWGTYVTTPRVSTSSATIELQVTLDNDSRRSGAVQVATEIYALDPDGRRTGVAVARIPAADVSIAPGASTTVRGSVDVANPRLWGPPPQQRPNLYVAVTSVSQERRPIDTYETRFGIRALRFDPNSGVYVNGERIFLKGVNQHGDLGALGVAFNYRAAQRQLEILREMGCNAVRTSHNPPAPELLELTDRMGFLVMDESFDVWYRRKTPLDAHLVFPDWHEQDLRALIRRDRNSPSVILWSVGNEVGEQYTNEEGAAVGKRLNDIAHDEDPTRPTTAAVNYAKPDMPFAAPFDVVSLNYQGEGIRYDGAYAGLKGITTPPQYEPFHRKFPDKVVLSSENASAFSSRGEYLFPVFPGASAPVSDGQGGDSRTRQVSGYELYTYAAGSSADKVFAAEDRHPFVAGGFVWTGWDYLGEPSPYDASRSSYYGIIDLAGFRKDRFYLYQSRWRPDLQVAHILPHWTWPERVGQVTPVHVFTSGDEAELFLNGRSLGRKKKGALEYRLRWDDVLYEPGELRVVAYKNAQPWATDVVRTAGTAARLDALPDRSEIRADGLDLSFVTVRVTDKDGIVAPRANNQIRFTIEGPGEIVATDNGDPTSFEPFHEPGRHAFHGLALVIVRGKAGQPGTIRLRADSDSLQGATVTLRSVAAK